VNAAKRCNRDVSLCTAISFSNHAHLCKRVKMNSEQIISVNSRIPCHFVSHRSTEAQRATGLLSGPGDDPERSRVPLLVTYITTVRVSIYIILYQTVLFHIKYRANKFLNGKKIILLSFPVHISTKASTEVFKGVSRMNSI